MSLDTAARPLNEKRNRSYFIWEHGKPPDVVIEIVANKEGGELDRKSSCRITWAESHPGCRSRNLTENLANLDALPPKGFRVIVGVLPVREGTQAQVRILALVPGP